MKAVSAAKVQIGRACKFVGQNAIQIHGGMGMTDELAIGHYFKRATMIEGQSALSTTTSPLRGPEPRQGGVTQASSGQGEGLIRDLPRCPTGVRLSLATVISDYAPS
jgi:hypothetical protein